MSSRPSYYPAVGLGGVDMAQPYMLAAVHCKQTADEIMKLSDKVNNLEAMVAAAWKGDSASSLTNSLVDKASLVSYAAGVLRDAAVQLQRAGTYVAHQQALATERAARNGY